MEYACRSNILKDHESFHDYLASFFADKDMLIVKAGTCITVMHLLYLNHAGHPRKVLAVDRREIPARS